MGNAALLKKYVKLMVEAVVEGPKPPLQLMGPFTPAKGGDFAIYREFPLVPTPEIMQLMKLDASDLDENGNIPGEHEIFLDLTDIYHTKPERGNYEYPGDPGEFLVEGYEVLSINGIALSPADAATVKNYVGDLTDKETDQAYDHYMDSMPEPDFDDGGYDPY